MIDKVDLAFGCARLLPSIGQRAERIGGAAGRFAALGRGGGDRGHVRGRVYFSRILPCRAACQMTAKKKHTKVTPLTLDRRGNGDGETIGNRQSREENRRGNREKKLDKNIFVIEFYARSPACTA